MRKSWAALAAATLGTAVPAFGVSGTWTQTVGGTFDWGDTGNWSGGTVAGGDSGDVATMSAILAGDQTINLGATRTIGTLTLSGGTGGDYTVASGGGSLTFTQATTANLNLDSANIGATISADLALSQLLTIANSSGKGLTLSGTISGASGALSVTSGTLLLSGANSYGGATTLAANTTIDYANSAAFGTAPLNLTSGTFSPAAASLNVTNNINVNSGTNNTTFPTFGGSIATQFSGAIAVTANRTITLTNTGGVTFSGPVSLTNNLLLAGTEKAEFSGLVTMNGNRNFNISNTSLDGIIYSGGIGESSLNALFRLTKGGGTGGTGTMTIMTTASTYTGGTTISAGTLNANVAGALGTSGGVTVSGAVSTGTILNLNVPNALSGSISLRVAGSGANSANVNMNSANNYSGGTVILNGAVGYINFFDQGAFGSGVLDFQGGNLVPMAAGLVVPNALRIAAGGSDGFIGGTVPVEFSGPATVFSSTTPTDRSINVTNTSAGGVTLSGGIGESVAGMIFNINRNDPPSGPTSIGTLNITGPGTYTGGTNLYAGTLNVGNNTALGTGPLNINAGTIAPTASLLNGVLANPLTLNGDFTIAGVNPLQFSGAATLADNRIITVSNSSAGGVTLSGGIGETASFSLTKAGAGTLNLSGTLSYTGATSVTDGKLLLQTNLTTSPSVSVAGSTSVLELATGGGNNRVIITPTVAVTSGGKIDLQDNKAIISGQSAAVISALVDSGRNTGNWDGATGIITSQSNAKSAQNITTLAVAAADAPNVGKTTFGGQPVTTETLVMYTWNGDANLSGNVDADDYFAIDSNYSKSGTVFGFNNGDFNYDDLINGDDYAAIDAGFMANLTNPNFPGAPPLGGMTAVPEPASLFGLLLSVTATGLLRRQRRNRR